MDARQPVLIDMTPYLDREGTILGAVDDAEAQQQEEAAAERAAEGIRAMITAPAPAGAAARWRAAMGVQETETAPEPEPEAADREQAETAPVTGPWGVFEDDMCVVSVSDRRTADQLAGELRADGGNAKVVVLPLCVEHRDAEQPRGTCEECANDGEERELPALWELFGKNRPEGAIVHAYDVPCGEFGGVHYDWNDSEVNCEECLRLTHPERYEEEADDQAPAEGRVITHQGVTLGSEPGVADDPDTRDAIAVLVAAGHVPAPLTGEYDDETCEADGFMVHPRGEGSVYVYHLVNGQHVTDMREWWTTDLKAYREALDAAGWTTSKPGMVLRATRPAPKEAAPEVDVNALGLSPLARALVLDIDAGPWHYQTRKKVFDLGITADIEATALTPYGETVRAALAG